MPIILHTDTRSLSGDMAQVAALTVCYYNVGVELEFERRPVEATHHFQKGLDIASAHLGDLHPVSIQLKRALVSAHNKYHRELQAEVRTLCCVSLFTHSQSHIHIHSRSCTCCDEIKGTPDQDLFSCSFSDSLSGQTEKYLFFSLWSDLWSRFQDVSL